MLLDKQNTVSDQQTLVATSGSTVVSTNSIDLGATTTDSLGNTVLSDVGRVKGVELLTQVTVAATSGGSATVRFDLITATNAALSSGVVIHQSTRAIPVAELVAGYQFKLEVPPGIPATGRYLGVQFTIGTADTTAGAFTCGIVADKQTNLLVG